MGVPNKSPPPFPAACIEQLALGEGGAAVAEAMVEKVRLVVDEHVRACRTVTYRRRSVATHGELTLANQPWRTHAAVACVLSHCQHVPSPVARQLDVLPES